MNVVIRPVHFDASVALVDYINKRLLKLETYFDRIVEAEIFLKMGTKQNIKDKIVEVKLHVPWKKHCLCAKRPKPLKKAPTRLCTQLPFS